MVDEAAGEELGQGQPQNINYGGDAVYTLPRALLQPATHSSPTAATMSTTGGNASAVPAPTARSALRDGVQMYVLDERSGVNIPMACLADGSASKDNDAARQARARQGSRAEGGAANAGRPRRGPRGSTEPRTTSSRTTHSGALNTSNHAGSNSSASSSSNTTRTAPAPAVEKAQEAGHRHGHPTAMQRAYYMLRHRRPMNSRSASHGRASGRSHRAGAHHTRRKDAPALSPSLTSTQPTARSTSGSVQSRQSYTSHAPRHGSAGSRGQSSESVLSLSYELTLDDDDEEEDEEENEEGEESESVVMPAQDTTTTTTTTAGSRNGRTRASTNAPQLLTSSTQNEAAYRDMSQSGNQPASSSNSNSNNNNNNNNNNNTSRSSRHNSTAIISATTTGAAIAAAAGEGGRGRTGGSKWRRGRTRRESSRSATPAARSASASSLRHDVLGLSSEERSGRRGGKGEVRSGAEAGDGAATTSGGKTSREADAHGNGRRKDGSAKAHASFSLGRLHRFFSRHSGLGHDYSFAHHSSSLETEMSTLHPLSSLHRGHSLSRRHNSTHYGSMNSFNDGLSHGSTFYRSFLGDLPSTRFTAATAYPGVVMTGSGRSFVADPQGANLSSYFAPTDQANANHTSSNAANADNPLLMLPNRNRLSGVNGTPNSLMRLSMSGAMGPEALQGAHYSLYGYDDRPNFMQGGTSFIQPGRSFALMNNNNNNNHDHHNNNDRRDDEQIGTNGNLLANSSNTNNIVNSNNNTAAAAMGLNGEACNPNDQSVSAVGGPGFGLARRRLSRLQSIVPNALNMADVVDDMPSYGGRPQDLLLPQIQTQQPQQQQQGEQQQTLAETSMNKYSARGYLQRAHEVMAPDAARAMQQQQQQDEAAAQQQQQGEQQQQQAEEEQQHRHRHHSLLPGPKHSYRHGSHRAKQAEEEERRQAQVQQQQQVVAANNAQMADKLQEEAAVGQPGNTNLPAHYFTMDNTNNSGSNGNHHNNNTNNTTAMMDGNVIMSVQKANGQVGNNNIISASSSNSTSSATTTDSRSSTNGITQQTQQDTPGATLSQPPGGTAAADTVLQPPVVELQAQQEQPPHRQQHSHHQPPQGRGGDRALHTHGEDHTQRSANSSRANSSASHSLVASDFEYGSTSYSRSSTLHSTTSRASSGSSIDRGTAVALKRKASRVKKASRQSSEEFAQSPARHGRRLSLPPRQAQLQPGPLQLLPPQAATTAAMQLQQQQQQQQLPPNSLSATEEWRSASSSARKRRTMHEELDKVTVTSPRSMKQRLQLQQQQQQQQMMQQGDEGMMRDVPALSHAMAQSAAPWSAPSPRRMGLRPAADMGLARSHSSQTDPQASPSKIYDTGTMNSSADAAMLLAAQGINHGNMNGGGGGDVMMFMRSLQAVQQQQQQQQQQMMQEQQQLSASGKAGAGVMHPTLTGEVKETHPLTAAALAAVGRGGSSPALSGPQSGSEPDAFAGRVMDSKESLLTLQQPPARRRKPPTVAFIPLSISPERFNLMEAKFKAV